MYHFLPHLTTWSSLYSGWSDHPNNIWYRAQILWLLIMQYLTLIRNTWKRMVWLHEIYHTVSLSHLREHYNYHYVYYWMGTYVMQLLGIECSDCNSAICWLWRTSICRKSCFSRDCKASVSLANDSRSFTWTLNKIMGNNNFFSTPKTKLNMTTIITIRLGYLMTLNSICYIACNDTIIVNYALEGIPKPITWHCHSICLDRLS